LQEMKEAGCLGEVALVLQLRSANERVLACSHVALERSVHASATIV
jgi:hypothetical protein